MSWEKGKEFSLNIIQTNDYTSIISDYSMLSTHRWIGCRFHWYY